MHRWLFLWRGNQREEEYFSSCSTRLFFVMPSLPFMNIATRLLGCVLLSRHSFRAVTGARRDGIPARRRVGRAAILIISHSPHPTPSLSPSFSLIPSPLHPTPSTYLRCKPSLVGLCIILSLNSPTARCFFLLVRLDARISRAAKTCEVSRRIVSHRAQVFLYNYTVIIPILLL